MSNMSFWSPDTDFMGNNSYISSLFCGAETSFVGTIKTFS